jgi:hypothetical protein
MSHPITSLIAAIKPQSLPSSLSTVFSPSKYDWMMGLMGSVNQTV